jgi:hypothetical protein
MGIFGKLDARNVSTNPFFVEEGEYTGVVESAKIVENKEKEKTQLIISYKITDKGNKYYGKLVTEWFTIYPEMDEETYASLSPEEQGIVDRNNTNVKRRLCGWSKPDGTVVSTGLGVPESELNEDWDPKVLLNIEVDLGVKNSGDDNEYTNVKWVRRADEAF